MRRIKKLILPLLIIICVAGTGLFLVNSKEKATPDLQQSMQDMEELLLSLDSINNDNYKKYIAEYRDEIYQGEDILCEQTQVAESDRTVDAKHSVSIEVPVEKAGLYVVGFDYKCMGDNILQTSLAMKCNGSYPYQELQHLFLLTHGQPAKNSMIVIIMKALQCPQKYQIGNLLI